MPGGWSVVARTYRQKNYELITHDRPKAEAEHIAKVLRSQYEYRHVGEFSSRRPSVRVVPASRIPGRGRITDADLRRE